MVSVEPTHWTAVATKNAGAGKVNAKASPGALGGHVA